MREFRVIIDTLDDTHTSKWESAPVQEIDRWRRDVNRFAGDEHSALLIDLEPTSGCEQRFMAIPSRTINWAIIEVRDTPAP